MNTTGFVPTTPDIVPTLVATKDHTLKIRVTSGELVSWTGAATLEGISLSQWIRGKCNAFTVTMDTVYEVSGIDRQVAHSRKPCKHGMLFCKKCK